YINGGSLEQLLQNKHIELPWETRIKLSLDIARGMCYLHSRGVFHRDLTSKNVLIKINADGMTAVVGDFGLAEKIPDSRDRSQRLPIVGSPYWMAPECLKGEWYNEKADVFSYGIILCEVIARVEADPDILPRTENFGVDYVAFSDMCPDCPPHFLELAFSCCRINPDSRPCFKDVVHQLEKLLNIISSMSGGSHLFYPPVVYTSCWDDGDNIDSVRAIFAHGWTRSSPTQNKVKTKNCATPTKVSNSDFRRPPVTPKHVGEAMSMQDPHYKPNSSSQNPFASLPRFWKGKKFLEPSLNEIDLSHSVNFDLLSPRCAPTPPGTPVSQDQDISISFCQKPDKKHSKSLPTSPVLRRKSVKLQTLYSNSSTVEVPDSPRSVSPGPSFSPPSSLSPFEPDESFSGYNSVQEQMSDCKLDDSCNQLQGLDKIHLDTISMPHCESPGTVTFRTKTPSLCAKLRRSSGESGFFSVGDRNSTCDLSLESYHTQEDMPSWITDTSTESHLNDTQSDIDDSGQTNGSSRKRPSSCYSDDSCYCCGVNSQICCEIRLNTHSEMYKEHEGKVAVPYTNLPNFQKPVQSLVTDINYSCHLCSAENSCNHKESCVLKELSSQVNIQSESSVFNHNQVGRHHVNTVLSKMCEKGNRIVKCMRTSPEL
ncbi:mitogen-activated protein kinase kinase kinase 7-like, partial [Stegodyphus dumicola]|uniref:mitogen-activated protein kinase kinase kinase 7-like n=1 Tax=Stegodyphus dumicola TaxID=202533 RepID=UPI0015AD83B3